MLKRMTPLSGRNRVVLFPRGGAVPSKAREEVMIPRQIIRCRPREPGSTKTLHQNGKGVPIAVNAEP